MTSTDVTQGKPHPEPFLKAAAQLGFPATECVVVEDVPARISAGKADGARVIAFRTTVEEAELRRAGADSVVDNCTDVGVAHNAEGLTLILNETLLTIRTLRANLTIRTLRANKVGGL